MSREQMLRQAVRNGIIDYEVALACLMLEGWSRPEAHAFLTGTLVAIKKPTERLIVVRR